MVRALSSTVTGKERPQLIAARHQLQLSLAEVAKPLGVTKATVYRWEKRGDIPQPLHLRELCKLYRKSPRELGFDDDQAVDVQTVTAMEETDDASSSFRRQDLTLCLMRIVWGWSHRNARYHELQLLITLELEDDNMTHDEMTRRDALRRLASLPIEWCGLSALFAVFKRSNEEILAQCAAGITACWYLRDGTELTFVSDTISKYIPTLKEIAKSSPDAQQKAAADLLAQTLLLKAHLAKHITTNNDAIVYAQQAEKYSEKAENKLLQVLSVRMQTSSHYYANHWEQALQTAEKAKYLLLQAAKEKDPLPRIVHSYIHAGLASCQAHNGQEQDALTSLGKAHTALAESSSDEYAPVWIHHNKANLVLNDGLTHLHLGKYKEAFDSFGQVANVFYGSSEVIRVEAMINQVMAEVSRDDQPRDMEWCIDCWKEGIKGARALRSEEWFSEASQAYVTMRAVWPGEQRIKSLRDHIIHW